MKLDAQIVEKVSKAGKPYKVLSIVIGYGITKDVFLSDAEMALLSLSEGN